ncbi:MAG: N-acetylglucosamine kinase [Bacteroidetes bacterium]|nr:N-acetylglucosamine kinase [Bacteroidota bacterium]
MNILIADSGSTKCEWCLLHGKKSSVVETQGMSPYFLNKKQIEQIIEKELVPCLKKNVPDEIYYYGTGCASAVNRKMIHGAIKKIFPKAKVQVDHDLMGAARAVCGNKKGVVCNLGTGSFACYFDGKKIVKSRPGLGYVLGDEGSGAYLGRKVLQYYLYGTFDEELRYRFDASYVTNRAEILENVYKKPMPNRYLASFAIFLAQNRGHYMIENIIEDGLNDFFFHHVCKFSESWKLPIHFIGSIAYGFKDVIQQLCGSYEFELGQVLRKPIDGLVDYHRK